MLDAQLDAFIETDILRFLDNRLVPAERDSAQPDPGAPMPFLTRDYEREINTALDASDLRRAKRVLRDLKHRFDEAPSGTAEKNQLKTLLVALYERFRIRVEHDDEQNVADTDLARLMRSWGIQPIEPTVPLPPRELTIDVEAQHAIDALPPRQDSPLDPAAAQPTAVATADDPAREETAPHLAADAQEREALIAHARDLLDTVERRLRSGDLRGAVRVYRETRRDVLAIEGGVPDDLAQRFLDAFTRLRQEILARSATGGRVPAAEPLPTLSSVTDDGARHPIQPAELPALPPLPSSRHDAARERTDAATPTDGPRSQASAPELPPAPAATADSAEAATAFDRSLLAQLDTRKRELDAAAQQHDFAAAMRAYDAMRTAALYLRDPALQADAARKLRLIHDLLMRLRHAAGDGDRHLARTVP